MTTILIFTTTIYLTNERGGDYMASDKFEIEGTVNKIIKGGKCLVTIENGNEITCTLSGKLRQNKIRVLIGDTVTVAMSPYDLSKGIITWRNK